MTFDEYFQSTWPDHWATLKMYDENSPAVDYFDVLLPRRIRVAAERAWNDGRTAALLEAADMLADCRFEDHWLEPANAVRRMAEGEK